MGGPPVDNVSIDEEGDKTMVRLVAMAMVFGLGLAWYSLRSLKLTLIVFACGLLEHHDRPGAGAHQRRHDRRRSAVDALAAVHPGHLGIDPSDQLLSRRGCGSRLIQHRGPSVEARLEADFVLQRNDGHRARSLYASEIVPIRKFGVYSAWGVVAMLAILFFTCRPL